MLHRSLSIAIVAFWLLMMTLLVRNEVSPETSGLREVHIGHVLKQLYLHEQASELRIWAGSKPLGNFRLHPHIDKESGARVMDFTGTLQIHSTPEQRHRISWDGQLHLSSNYEVLASDWAITVQDPGYLRIEVKTVADSPTAHLVVRSREEVVDERDVALNEAGFAGLAQQVGATGEIAALLQQPAAKIQPVVRARLSSLQFLGERTETYLVTVEHGGQTYIEAHFSQLGQVLQAKTLLGYTLRTDDL